MVGEEVECGGAYPNNSRAGVLKERVEVDQNATIEDSLSLSIIACYNVAQCSQCRQLQENGEIIYEERGIGREGWREGGREGGRGLTTTLFSLWARRGTSLGITPDSTTTWGWERK